jgi:hypothetical protein
MNKILVTGGDGLVGHALRRLNSLELVFISRKDASKPDGQYRKPTDTTKLRKYLPDFEFTPIEQGIEKTVEWFLAKYPNLRM